LPNGQLARYLKPLEKKHSPERIALELGAYLKQTPPQYMNLAKFAACFGAWSPAVPVVKNPPPLPPVRPIVEYLTPGGRLRYKEAEG
jgi:hypothetical protein